jgi:hypothetical protein
MALVRHLDFDGRTLRSSNSHPHETLGLRDSVERVHRIDEQIDQNLLEVNPVTKDLGQSRSNVGLHPDMTRRRVAPHERENIPDHFAQCDGLRVQTAAFEQGSQSINDVARPVIVAQDVRDDGSQFLDCPPTESGMVKLDLMPARPTVPAAYGRRSNL